MGEIGFLGNLGRWVIKVLNGKIRRAAILL